MKNKMFVLIIIGLVILSVIFILCIVFRPKKTKISKIKSLSFSYSQGYSAYAYNRYSLEYKENKYIATVKPYGIPDDDFVEVNVDENFVQKIEDILSKYNVGSWDGFHKSDKYVLDGDSFSLSVHFIDDTSISASGYMRWPENYGNVRNELDSLFIGLYDNNK